MKLEPEWKNQEEKEDRQVPTIVWILLILVALAGGGAAGFVYRRNVAEQKIGRT